MAIWVESGLLFEVYLIKSNTLLILIAIPMNILILGKNFS